MPANSSGHSHHDHSHSHDPMDELRGASIRALTIAMIMKLGYMLVDIVGGVLAGSLSLLAHAGHMFTDAASIGLALFAVHFAARAATAQRTFGYHRAEILAALVNALTLWVVSTLVLLEAYDRITGGIAGDHDHDVEGGLMLIIGAVGFGINALVAWMLHASARHSVNVEAAYRHVIADLLGSVAVVVSAILVWAYDWDIADPISGAVVAILILLSTWHLLSKVIHVLLEGVPAHIDVYRLCSTIEDLPGVTVVHDIHVWTLTPGYEALTAHVLVDPEHGGDHDAMLDRIRHIAYEDFGIGHITIQLETSAANCAEDHHVDHLMATAAS
jgi:cobalt-zinc-cadmium efflux system protein